MESQQKTGIPLLIITNTISGNHVTIMQISDSSATPVTHSAIALHQMISRITDSTISAANRKRSFIINDIAPEIQVHANENLLATLFGSVLNTVITHTQNCCIRITALIYGEVVMISVKDSQQVNGHAFASSIRQVQQLAARMGAGIGFNSHHRETSVVFSFSKQLTQAA